MTSAGRTTPSSRNSASRTIFSVRTDETDCTPTSTTWSASAIASNCQSSNVQGTSSTTAPASRRHSPKNECRWRAETPPGASSW
jgi:hypothetical protein